MAAIGTSLALAKRILVKRGHLACNPLYHGGRRPPWLHQPCAHGPTSTMDGKAVFE